MWRQHLDHSITEARPEFAVDRDATAVIQTRRAAHDSNHCLPTYMIICPQGIKMWVTSMEVLRHLTVEATPRAAARSG